MRSLTITLALLTVSATACGTASAATAPTVTAPTDNPTGPTHAHADPALTPGAVDYRATTDSLCHHKLPARTVTEADKNRVWAKYRIVKEQRRFYVLDDLLPREVGGLNAEANLWPQPKAESYAKDHVEDDWHRMICTGQKTIGQALDYFHSNWG